MGAQSLQRSLGVSRGEAEQFLSDHKRAFPVLFDFLQSIRGEAASSGFVTTAFGRVRPIQGISSSLAFVRAQAERIAVNSVIQGTQADVIKLAMICVDAMLEEEKLHNDARMVMQIHDELLFEIRPKVADTVIPKLVECMESIYPPDKKPIPLSANVKRGVAWGRLHSGCSVFSPVFLSVPLSSERFRRSVVYTAYMLYAFCGDRYAAREHCRAFVEVCKKKRELAEYVYLSSAVTHQSLEEMLLGRGLFESKSIVFCDEMLGEPSGEHLLNNPGQYHASPNMFVVFEPKMTVTHEKLFAKSGATVKRFKEQTQREDARTLFAFTDIFLTGNTAKSFAAFHRLVRNGESPSSILNILLWQIRMLTLVSQSATADEAGIKPFVYTKTKKALSIHPDPFILFLNAEKTVRAARPSRCD